MVKTETIWTFQLANPDEPTQAFDLKFYRAEDYAQWQPFLDWLNEKIKEYKND